MTTYTWTKGVSGDWDTAEDWSPAGPPNAATANAVIDAIGSYTVTIGGGESVLANALTLAAAGATLSEAGTLTLNQIINDGRIDIAGGTVDLSLGTLSNAGVFTILGGTVDLSLGTLNSTGVITIGSDGALDGKLILNAIAANGGGITIAPGGTLDLLGARTLSGGAVAVLGNVTSTGGLLLIGGSLDLGGGTLDVAATGPLSEFGVAGELANGTVDADAGAIVLENGAILNNVTWQGTLTIFGTESIAGVAGGNGINVAGGSLSNDGTITGGAGANGVFATASSLTNSATITGGHGSIGVYLTSAAGNGGAGVLLDAGSTMSNIGLINGGAAGYTFGPTLDFAAPGDGADVTNSTLINHGTILAGDLGLDRGGEAGVNLTNGTLTNDGTVSGGSLGVGVNAKGGRVTNDGTIAGGAGFNGVNATGASLTNSGTITGGAKARGVNATGGSLTNSGTITGGDGSIGTRFSGGGNGGVGVSLDAGGDMLNTGLIKGGYPGGIRGPGYIFANPGDGADVTDSTLTNDGTILAGDGSPNQGGGAGVALTNGTLTNHGSIGAGLSGYYSGAGVIVTGGLLTNDGTITGGDAYLSVGGIGVLFQGGGTLTDAGFIGGGNAGDGSTADAVDFRAAASRLILQPGASFRGSVVADAAFSNVLELASAASIGTLAGLGSLFIGFAQITIDAGASWMMSGANTIAHGATLTELSGATLVDSGTLVNDGAIVLGPSSMTVLGLTGTGSVTLEAGSALEVQGTIASGETLAFGGGGAMLHLDSPGGVAGTVTNFGFGETIDLKGIDPTSVSYDDGTLSFTGGSFALSLAGTGPVTAANSADGAAVTARCFRAGTRILTPSGERQVQELAVGDLVSTVLGEASAAIVWVGRREVDCARHPRPRQVWPVRVAADAFGPGRPHVDLFLSPDHAVYVGEVLIPVKFLINGGTIGQVPVDRVIYHHLELAEHDVLLAEGLPAESYLRTGDRFDFETDGAPLALYPDFSPRRSDSAYMWDALGCAPLIVSGAGLQAARMLVNARAAATPSNRRGSKKCGARAALWPASPCRAV